MKSLRLLSILIIIAGIFTLSSCSDPYDEISKELPTEPSGGDTSSVGPRD